MEFSGFSTRRNLPTGDFREKPVDDREGAWVVYTQTLTPVVEAPSPLFISNDVIIAQQYQEAVAKIGYSTYLKFWKFGDEWGTE